MLESLFICVDLRSSAVQLQDSDLIFRQPPRDVLPDERQFALAHELNRLRAIRRHQRLDCVPDHQRQILIRAVRLVSNEALGDFPAFGQRQPLQRGLFLAPSALVAAVIVSWPVLMRMI